MRTRTTALVISLLGAFLCISIASPPLSSQTQPQQPSFEAASIKIVDWEQGDYHGGSCHGIDSKYRPQVGVTPPPLGRCVFPSTILNNVIEYAYQLPNKKPFPIVGGDKWTGSDAAAFEIQAVTGAPEKTTEEQLRSMLQNLLHERFKLQFHRDSREEQGYALLRAENGRPLKPAGDNEARPGVIFIHADGPEFVITGNDVQLEAFVNWLGGDLHQPVLDETGLDGRYDIVFHFTPGAGEGMKSPSPSDPPGPSVFTALRDQLRLRLEPRKISVPIFVIDHVEKPRPN